MSELAYLLKEEHIAPLDAELGRLLMRRAASKLGDVERARVVGLTGALLSARRAAGNSCLDLAALAATAPWPDAGVVLPAMDAWRETLEASGMCGDGGSPAPLVLDGDRLYLHRYHAAESRLATHVRGRLAHPAASLPDESVRALFRKLFPTADATDWQAVAAAAALRARLTVITGGPGTGKTTTVARILALIAAQRPDCHIALAAPTGKAAARLAGAIADAPLHVDDAVLARIRVGGQTLHRLLGYEPWRDTFRHGADEPLPFDVIVVDEASMIDLLLMERLFAAAASDARVILLGDPDQLASVEAGYVLGDLCRAADECGLVHGAEFGAWVESLSGTAMECGGEPAPLRDVVVRLRRSYRFEAQAGIGAAATAVRDGDVDAACRALDGRNQDAVRRDPTRAVAALLQPIIPRLEKYLASATPDDALANLRSFRILTPHRRGAAGVEGLNASVERWAQARRVHTRTPWYHLRPLLVTANDPATRLYNGDVGVVFATDGRTEAWFDSPDGGVRAVPLSRLPAHETAWAMTVHKSQGSEFDEVMLVLPEEESPVVTRELLYTGITRARERITVVASESSLRAGIARQAVRASGLAARLGEPAQRT